MLERRSWERKFPLAVVWAGVLSAGLLQGLPARAAETGRASSSLQFIPADAAFYCTMLRNREQLEAVLHSNAWARIKALPFVQAGWAMAKIQFSEDGKLAPLYQFYQQPENRQLLALAGDMFSHEVFVYGSESWAGFSQLMLEVYSSAQYGPLFAMLKGEAGDLNPQQLRAKMALKSLAENRKLLRVPDLIMGFKVSKIDRAQAQLKRLEKLLDRALQHEPKLKGRFKREKVAGSDFLTLHLDGSLVPWDDLPIKDLEDKEGEYDALIKQLKGEHLTVSVGVRDGYLLLSMGRSNAHLARLGQGPRLADRPEFRPLAKFADKPIVSVTYFSKKLSAQVAAGTADIHSMVEWAKQFLPEGVSAKKRAAIEKQLEGLGKDVSAYLPKPGARFSFSFLNGRGYEGYSYDWTGYPQRDGSKPLTLLHHAGSEPLLVVAGRSRTSIDQYRMAAKFVRLAKEYADVYVQAKADDENKEKYQKFFDGLGPVFKRLNEVTEQFMVPALADGQAAFVLDARLKSKQWFKLLPEADTALPMLEPAIVVGVSDEAKLRKAFGEYRVLANQLLAKLHEVDEDKVPELKIPKPKTAKVLGGRLYFYPLPEQWGLDKRLAPTAGISDENAHPAVLALTISADHAKRLMGATPLKVRNGPLAKTDRPLAAAVYFNGPRTIDAITPWVDLGVRVITPKAMRIDEDDPAEKARADQMVSVILGGAHTLFDVLKVFRSYSSATYRDNEVWVTHHQTVIRDLPSK
jgi:hypothetical protein